MRKERKPLLWEPFLNPLRDRDLVEDLKALIAELQAGVNELEETVKDSQDEDFVIPAHDAAVLCQNLEDANVLVRQTGRQLLAAISDQIEADEEILDPEYPEELD